MAIGNIFCPFGTYYDYIGNYVIIWYISTRLGILYTEKSGNPGTKQRSLKEK
jgi:hypothetical protein